MRNLGVDKRKEITEWKRLGNIFFSKRSYKNGIDGLVLELLLLSFKGSLPWLWLQKNRNLDISGLLSFQIVASLPQIHCIGLWDPFSKEWPPVFMLRLIRHNTHSQSLEFLTQLLLMVKNLNEKIPSSLS